LLAAIGNFSKGGLKSSKVNSYRHMNVHVWESVRSHWIWRWDALYFALAVAHFMSVLVAYAGGTDNAMGACLNPHLDCCRIASKPRRMPVLRPRQAVAV